MTNPTNKTNSVGSGELDRELRDVLLIHAFRYEDDGAIDEEEVQEALVELRQLFTDQKLSLLAELEEKAETLWDDETASMLIQAVPISVIKSKEEELK